MNRKRSVIGLVVFLIFFALAGISQRVTNGTPSETKQEVRGEAESLVAVTRVIDGDTIVVNIDGKDETVRLIGIDTPEIVHGNKKTECFGQEAKKKAEEILSGKRVRLEDDESQSNRDKYSRLLRYVFLEDGTLFNKWIITEGFAFEYTYQIPYRYQEEFKKAQMQAREESKGLWAQDACGRENNRLDN